VLFVGLMLTADGPKVLEFNCRFGDLDAQVLARVMDEDLLDLLHRTANGSLEGITIDEPSEAVVAVQLVSSGYPQQESDDKHVAIGGLADAAEIEDVELFVGNVVATGKGRTAGIAASGGRVLTVTAIASQVDVAAANALEAAGLVTFDGKHARTDVAAEAGILA
jgi:phosphoribosylamine--glycine ligase